MDQILLFSRYGIETGIQLTKYLINYGIDIWGINDTKTIIVKYSQNENKQITIRSSNNIRSNYEYLTNDKTPKILIRWGSTQSINVNQTILRETNKEEQIRNSVDKFIQFNILTSRNLQQPKYEYGYNGQVYCKSPFTSKPYENIKYDNISKQPPNAICTKQINITTEYRVHYIKLPAETNEYKMFVQKIKTKETDYFRFRNGCEFKVRDTIPTIVEQYGIEQIKSHGLDFGQADVGYDEKSKRQYVFEVNTSPGLMGINGKFGDDDLPNKGIIYVKQLKEFIEHNIYK